MAYDFDGTDDYIEAASAVVSGVPLTLACWFNSDLDTTTYTALSISNSGGSDSYELRVSGAVAGDPVQATAVAAGTAGSSSSATGFTAGTWHHGAAKFPATNSRQAFIDGVGGTVGTVVRSVGTLDRTNIGTAYATSARTRFFNGRVAECGIWNVGLDDAEIAALAKGYRCNMIRPLSLIFYAPLIRDVQDIMRGVSLTTSAPIVAVHPRRIG